VEAKRAVPLGDVNHPTLTLPRKAFVGGLPYDATEGQAMHTLIFASFPLFSVLFPPISHMYVSYLVLRARSLASHPLCRGYPQVLFAVRTGDGCDASSQPRDGLFSTRFLGTTPSLRRRLDCRPRCLVLMRCSSPFPSLRQQKPRGLAFVTFDSEETLESVLSRKEPILYDKKPVCAPIIFAKMAPWWISPE